MNRLLLLFFAIITALPSRAQNMTQEEVMKKIGTGKQYTFVMLKSGKAPSGTPEEIQKKQMDHLIHLFQMEKDGKISVFGPFTNDTALRGIIIFNTADTADVSRLLHEDPYIREGNMTYQLYNWFSIPGQKLP